MIRNNTPLRHAPVPLPSINYLQKDGKIPTKDLGKVTHIQNSGAQIQSTAPLEEAQVKAPPVKERTMFLSLEHSTVERMAFLSNRPCPKLDEKLLKYFNSKEFVHTPGKGSEKYRLYSDTAAESEFSAEYKPGEWSFSNTRRDSSEPFFANNVAVFQAAKIAEQYGFIGIVPSLIIRKNVNNTTTLKKTEGKSGEELQRIFLEETTNGKSTQRILNDFGLKAIKVERITLSEPGYLDEISFYIHVRPLPKEKIR